MELTKQEQHALKLLIDLGITVFFAMEDSEETACGGSLVPAMAADDISTVLDAMDALPDDRPGYALGPVDKAAWALRRLFGTEE